MLSLSDNRTFVIAEIGINHNGDIDIAKQLIDVAKSAGCDAVKFQKRTPELHVKPELRDTLRDTPWGMMTHWDYRHKIEFSGAQYKEISAYCEDKKILFTASPWDIPAADLLHRLDVPFFKVASAAVTNVLLLDAVSRMGKPVIMSTGMSTLQEIRSAVWDFKKGFVPQIGLLACTSCYPCKSEDLNLERIHTLQHEFPNAVIGYSGHEPGLWTTLCAVAMGARIIERHITLDRTMRGSDHASSIEPGGLHLLMREIRNFERAHGDGVIGPRDCELPDMKRLRP